MFLNGKKEEKDGGEEEGERKDERTTVDLAF